MKRLENQNNISNSLISLVNLNSLNGFLKTSACGSILCGLLNHGNPFTCNALVLFTPPDMNEHNRLKVDKSKILVHVRIWCIKKSAKVLMDLKMQHNLCQKTITKSISHHFYTIIIIIIDVKECSEMILIKPWLVYGVMDKRNRVSYIECWPQVIEISMSDDK